MMRRIIAFLLALLLIASAAPCIFATDLPEQTAQLPVQVATSLASANANQTEEAILVCDNPISAIAFAGNYQIVLGETNTEDCAVFDILSGKIKNRIHVGGQVDAVYISGDNLYVGTSDAATVTQIDLRNLDSKRILMSLANMFEQAAISTITDGYGLFFASIPEQYQYGGCLVHSLGNYYVVRNVVQDQSIVSLACYRDFLFGGTSIEGGLGTTPIEGASAKIFVFDAYRLQKVAEYDLRDYISGLPATIGSISGIVADPDVDTNHKFWGVAGGLLFSFVFDPETMEIQSIQRELDFGGTAESSLFPVPMVIQEGYLYTRLGTDGGVWKINLSNPEDNIQLPIPSTRLFVIANDGNLYYAADKELFRCSLDAVKTDKEAAQALDDRILAIGTDILASESAIRQIRADYEMMTDAQKALVQNLDKLRAAEIDLIKVKIESIGEVTLEDEAIIIEVMALYDDLTMDERAQLDYMFLMSANKSLTELQKKAAADVDALIAMIGTVTLKSKEAIQASRAAYDALTPGAKAYIKDLEILKEAEILLDEMTQAQEEKEKEQEQGQEQESDGFGLQPEAVTVIIIVAVAVVLAAGAVVTILVLKKRKKTA